jgi:hypothetical protein
MRRRTLAALLLLGCPILLRAWGTAGHHMVAREAIGTLPEPLRGFFARHEAFVEEHSLDPDHWREAGRPGEGPNHFLDIDAFPGEIDRDEATHLARRGVGSGAKGRLPWRIVEVVQDLAGHFGARDEGAILEDAAVLCHYVADGHVPFHALVNYDGQLTGQKGIHARFESRLVELHGAELEPALHPSPATTVADPLGYAFDILRASAALGDEALKADRESLSPGPNPYDAAYDEAFYSREREVLRSRLSSAATATGSLWLTAWEKAGRPPLP